MANKVTIEIVVDDKGSATVKSFGTATEQSFKKAEAAGASLGAGFAKTWAGISAGAAGVIYVFEKVKNAVAAPIKAYMESESALLKLGMAMKNQGDFSREALDDLEAFAGSIQDLTAYEDDLVIAMMGNLKSYGMTNEEVKRATRTALDFASAKKNEGMTVTSAGELIGKAYAGNTTMLGRYGIMIDDTIPKTEKYTAVMGQLNARFGGSAQAELATYSGQWAHLENIWGDIQENIGLPLLKILEGLLISSGLFAYAFMTAGENVLYVIRMITSPFTLLLDGFAKLAELAGLTRTADALHSISTATEEAQRSIVIAKEGVIAWTAKQYDAMVATGKVAAAIDDMGSAGQRTQQIDDEAATKRKTATASITEAIRKSTYEIEGIGQSQYEKEIARVDAEVEKYRKAGVDSVLIEQFATTEKTKALNESYERNKKTTDDYYNAFMQKKEEADAAEIAAGQQTLLTLAENKAKARLKEMDDMAKFIAEVNAMLDAQDAARLKGVAEYQELVSNEYEFAATENERAINKIIGQEEDKLNKLYPLYAAGIISYEEMEKAEILITTNAAAARLEIATTNAKKIADINYSALAAIRGYEDETYEARIKQIEATVAEWEKMKVPAATIAAYIADEFVKADIAKAKSSNDFFAGVTAGLMEMERAQITWGEAGAQTIKDFTTSGASSISSFIKDSWKGEWKSAGEYFDSFATDMVGKMGDLVGKLIAEWAVLEAWDLAKKAGKGISEWFGGVKAKEGMWNVGEGEDGIVPILAHEGEMILTKELATRVRNYLTEGATEGLSGAGMTVAGIGAIIGSYFGGKLGKQLGGDVGGVVGSIGGGYAGTYAGAWAAEGMGLTTSAGGAGTVAAGSSASAATIPVIGAIIAGALATKEYGAQYTDRGGVLGYAATASQTPVASATQPSQWLVDLGIIDSDSTLGQLAGGLGIVERFIVEDILGGFFGGGGMEKARMTPIVKAYADATGWAWGINGMGRTKTLTPEDDVYWQYMFDAWRKDNRVGIDPSISLSADTLARWMAYGTADIRPLTTLGSLPQNMSDVADYQAYRAANPYMVPEITPASQHGIPRYETGIDYVPRTGPAIIHQKEAVLNEEDADEWRAGQGGGRGNVYNFNFTLNSTVTDTRTFKGFARDIMREITHIEARQIRVQ